MLKTVAQQFQSDDKNTDQKFSLNVSQFKNNQAVYVFMHYIVNLLCCLVYYLRSL